MRPVSKGDAPKIYKEYGEARNDLIKRLGIYCSYCEMVITNIPAVEHVIPIKNGGSELEWDNFLLSCVYCNSNKSNNNKDRKEYLWPDKDDTFNAFIYEYGQPISVNNSMSSVQKRYAQNTINLLKLDREPNTKLWNNHKDMRPMSRLEAWQKAKESLNDWNDLPVEQLANAICRTAVSVGHFSIWMNVFEQHQLIQSKLVESFVGTNKKYFKNILL